MPNGGYPLSLVLTPTERPDLCLHLRGLDASLAAWATRPDGRRVLARPPLAAFTSDQSDALLHHLAYWGLGEQALPLLARRRPGWRSRFGMPGVEYDY